VSAPTITQLITLLILLSSFAISVSSFALFSYHLELWVLGPVAFNGFLELLAVFGLTAPSFGYQGCQFLVTFWNFLAASSLPLPLSELEALGSSWLFVQLAQPALLVLKNWPDVAVVGGSAQERRFSY
jgi:hypothetical protein